MERLTGVGNWSGKLKLVTRVSGVTGVGNWSNWSGTMGGDFLDFWPLKLSAYWSKVFIEIS